MPGTSNFGQGVSISGDGTLLLVTAARAAFVFRLAALSYSLFQQLITPSEVSPQYGLKRAAAMSNSGRRIILGDKGRQINGSVTRGTAVVFDLVNGLGFIQAPSNLSIPNLPSSSRNNIDGFGYAVAVTDENHVVIGAYAEHGYFGRFLQLRS